MTNNQPTAKSRKPLTLAIVVLLGVLVFAFAQNLTLRKNILKQENLYTTLSEEADKTQLLLQDSLNLYLFVASKARHFLNPEPNVHETELSDSTNLEKLRWHELFQNAAKNRKLKTQEINQLRASRQKAHRNEVVFKSLISNLNAEVAVKNDRLDSLARLASQQSGQLAHAQLANQVLHTKLDSLQRSFGSLEILNSEKQPVRYTGEIKDGKAYGLGVGIFNSKGVYEGYWKNDRRHGEGTYTWANGDTYQGEFVEGTREGFGTYTFSSGEKYIGHWKENLRNGKGVMYDKSGKVLLDGTWENDKFLKSVPPIQLE